ncbi:hypothetical protein HX038_02845 [Myroides odoratimimus]|uniref:hypothetical protein n=1 Tax=Myroides odoratimimus TaxID=76832 RepID=UPI000280A3C3|nr:hypothetical protein [Myroides odoratimimus]EKB03939.1 hypothetical protein HMPREF9711_02124 [Myroides odoratimimus CCUG 3837]MDM1400039.1 hypothetical protein [Myroides odoratimimus]MDM1409687.1 hypothetical protein [Myroides odoratimimus]MDO5856974.1 hypothetical protein [Myroides odoratimimus]
MKYILPILMVLGLTSCGGGETKKTDLETIDKQSAREVTIKSVVAGDSILHITSQKIWANGQLVTQKTDTIKTAKEVSAWGDTKPTSLVKVPIYVTVE